jgi:predicted RNase H-like nuclease
MKGGVALCSEKSRSGVIARRELLLARGIDLDGFRNHLAGRAAADDVLDAGAYAWTANKILRGEVQCIPDPPQFDATGGE